MFLGLIEQNWTLLSREDVNKKHFFIEPANIMSILIPLVFNIENIQITVSCMFYR